MRPLRGWVTGARSWDPRVPAPERRHSSAPREPRGLERRIAQSRRGDILLHVLRVWGEAATYVAPSALGAPGTSPFHGWRRWPCGRPLRGQRPRPGTPTEGGFWCRSAAGRQAWQRCESCSRSLRRRVCGGTLQQLSDAHALPPGSKADGSRNRSRGLCRRRREAIARTMVDARQRNRLQADRRVRPLLMVLGTRGTARPGSGGVPPAWSYSGDAGAGTLWVRRAPGTGGPCHRALFPRPSRRRTTDPFRRTVGRGGRTAQPRATPWDPDDDRSHVRLRRGAGRSAPA